MIEKNKKMKRVNILIPEDMYTEIVTHRGLKLSGTIREALEDALCESKITFSVSKETKDAYLSLFNESSCLDSDIEPYLRQALSNFVEDLIHQKVSPLKKIQEDLQASASHS